MEIPIGFTHTSCASCSIPHFISTAFYERRLKDKKDFYCPAGHANVFGGDTEEQRLRRRLLSEQETTAQLLRELAAIKKAKRKSAKKKGK